MWPYCLAWIVPIKQAHKAIPITVVSYLHQRYDRAKMRKEPRVANIFC